MNKYQVRLYSVVDENATVSIIFLVNSGMSAKELKIYYECISLKISDVEVLEVL
jgi:hypothetical protein